MISSGLTRIHLFSFFDLPCRANSSGFYAVLIGLLRSSTIPSQTNQMIWLKPKTPVIRSVKPGISEMMPTAPANGSYFDGRTVQSPRESGECAGYDGHKRKKGSKIHVAVDTLGLLLAAHVTPVNEQERVQVKQLAKEVQEVTHNSVEMVFDDQGYTGDEPEQEAMQAGIDLIVVKLPEAKKGFVLLLRRWVIERSFAWTVRFRRLARDFDRTPETLRSLHFLAFAILMLKAFVKTIAHVL